MKKIKKQKKREDEEFKECDVVSKSFYVRGRLEFPLNPKKRSYVAYRRQSPVNYKKYKTPFSHMHHKSVGVRHSVPSILLI